ncbi:hypothetical protein Taro_011432 [Colocasia esculenta]|uniref:Uncharacterized protein n=1 Tax=Colocasia esculenta TaxID=4460 RepID=A0A843U5U8_COLES|nr:hypothetical protein [Colocasia esculenta]
MKLENAWKFVTLIRLKLGRGNLSWIGMQSCILGNPNSCLTMVGGFLKPHTLKERKKPSLNRKLTSQNCNPAFLVTIGLLKHHGSLNTLHKTLGMSFRTCWGRVEKFLVAGEQEIIHTKPFFFHVESAATCTDGHLEVDQRVIIWGTSVDTTWTSVDTLSQTSTEGVLDRSLVSTLPGLVSTHCPRLTQKVLGAVSSVDTT